MTQFQSIIQVSADLPQRSSAKTCKLFLETSWVCQAFVVNQTKNTTELKHNQKVI